MGRIRRGPQRGQETRKNIPYGQAHVQATFNNTTFAERSTGQRDRMGQRWTAGSSGQGHAPAARRLPSRTENAKEHGMQEVDVFVKGPGPGREAAIRAIQASGLKVRSITDVTPVPHNGVRPPKKRRV